MRKTTTTPRVKELNENLDSLARECVLHQEGWGKRYIKGMRKGKRRKVFLLDEKVLKKILASLQPYIWRAVVNSKGYFDEDLASILRCEVWKVLRFEGSKDFSSIIKLRIMNFCTTQHNISSRAKKRNININAVSYYNEYGTEEGEMILLDSLPDRSTTDHTILSLLDEKEKECLDELMGTIENGRKKDKKYFDNFVNNNFNIILGIYNKIA